MEGKLKKEELLKVIGQMEVIEKLPKQLLDELCRVFKVQELNAPQSYLIQQFKTKVVDIFMQQTDGYMDYLQLPKFKSLGPDSTEKMQTLFSNIWKEYGIHIVRQQAYQAKKQIDDITPSFDNPQKMEQFHLRLLQIYRDSAICPKNARQNHKNIQDPKPISQPPQINNFLFPSQSLNNAGLGNMQMSAYNPFNYPFVQAPNFPKVEAHQGNPYIIQNKMANNSHHQPIFQMPRFGLQPHNHPPFFAPTTDIFPGMRNSQQKQQELPVIRNLFSEPIEASTSAFFRYDFIQCVCEGKKGQQDKNSFQCIFCKYTYHLSCMKIQSSPAGGSVCPLCILRRQTIFCKVTHQPLKFNWHLSQKGKELKVEMTEHQSNLIYEARKNGLDCQIRFLKINGKSVKKEKRMTDFTSCNGYLLKTTRHTEITLPELSEDRHQPISLEIVLRSQEDNGEQNTSKLYLFAVFLITMKKVDDIVNELFSSNRCCGIEYYNQYMNTQGKVVVNLQSEMFGKVQVSYPVRGQQCKHADVFDLRHFLEVVKDLKRDNNSEINCPICSVACTYFIYDKTIFNAIRNFPDYDMKKPEAISIERSGEYFWVGNDANNGEGQAMQGQEIMRDQQKFEEEF